MSYRRFIRDEAGMTMGLAVIMIVLIGVMGAGLLTFVSTDLNAVIEVNRGQRAMELADAGIDAGKNQLNVDATTVHYNDVVGVDEDGDGQTSDDDSAWSDDGTPKELDFDGDGVPDIKVWIQYLLPSTATQSSLPNHAPEVLPSFGSDVCNDTNSDGVDDDLNLDPAVNDLNACQYPNNRNYFRVTAQGMEGNAVRKVQAIYRSQNYQFPVAYFATRDIIIGDTAATVRDVSLFANRYILGLRPPTGTAPAQRGTLRGVDKAYGNWATYPTGNLAGQPNPYNSVARTTDAAGAAALGNPAVPTACTTTGSPRITNEGSGIAYDPAARNGDQKNRSAGTYQVYGNRDYDRDSDYRCPSSTLTPSGRPDFERNTWGVLANQPADTVTFPFEVNDTGTDEDILAALKQKAQADGHYVFAPNNGEIWIGDATGPKTPAEAVYPPDSDENTVMYIEFADGTEGSPVHGGDGSVVYKPNGTSNSDGYARGTIVVINGDFDTNSSANNFQGIIAVRDADDLDDQSNVDNLMQFDNGGDLDINGYANVEGDIKIRGSVDGLLPGELVNGIPGIYSLSQWSWRECYTTSCN